MTIVYTPTSAYSPKLDTAITKQNLITGLMLFGTRIVKSVTTTGNSVIYTVPVGKTFFMNTASLCVNSVTAPTQGDIWINNDLTTNILRAKVSANNQNSIATLNFSTLIKLNSTEKVSVYHQATDGTSMGCISGYEIDSALLPNFN